MDALCRILRRGVRVQSLLLPQNCATGLFFLLEDFMEDKVCERGLNKSQKRISSLTKTTQVFANLARKKAFLLQYEIYSRERPIVGGLSL